MTKKRKAITLRNITERSIEDIDEVGKRLFGDTPVDRTGVAQLPEPFREVLQREFENSTMLYDFEYVWLNKAGQDVNVAVIDSGIDYRHAAFKDCAIHHAARIFENDVTDVIVNGEPVDSADLDLIDDKNGHGTHCAGIIAARPLVWIKNEFVPYVPIIKKGNTSLGEKKSNGRRDFQWEPCEKFLDKAKGHKKVNFDDLTIRFSGVAPRAKLMIYKVTIDEDENSLAEAYVRDIALAIEKATDDGADIISISMIAEEATDHLYFAVQRALMLGRMVIAAAGNEGFLASPGGYPASFGGVITVGSHGRFAESSDFSSTIGEVDFGMPGQEIWSPYRDRQYHRLSGTSMAAPYGAGLAALMLADKEAKIHNNEDLRREFLKIAAHPDWYDPRYLGYGPLKPGNYVGRVPLQPDSETRIDDGDLASNG